jgi:hypothetical protein
MKHCATVSVTASSHDRVARVVIHVSSRQFTSIDESVRQRRHCRNEDATEMHCRIQKDRTDKVQCVTIQDQRTCPVAILRCDCLLEEHNGMLYCSIPYSLLKSSEIAECEAATNVPGVFNRLS